MVKLTALSKLAVGSDIAVASSQSTVTFCPAVRCASAAAIARSISTHVRCATRARIRSVVTPGPGPTSSTLSPSWTSSKVQGSAYFSTVSLHRSERQSRLWIRFIGTPQDRVSSRNGRSCGDCSAAPECHNSDELTRYIEEAANRPSPKERGHGRYGADRRDALRLELRCELDEQIGELLGRFTVHRVRHLWE